jgi:uncharacterized protein
MKLLAKFGIALLSVLLLAAAAHAEPVSQLRPTGYVNDFAHVLEQKAVAQIEGLCQQIDQKDHAQIAVVTINSLDGSDAESYAVNLFKSWGIGDNLNPLLSPHPQSSGLRLRIPNNEMRSG